MNDVQKQLIQAAVSGLASDEQMAQALAILKGAEHLDKQKAEDRFLSIKDACQYAGGWSRTMLWQARKNGLKQYEIGGRVVIRQSELDNFITSRGA